MGPPPPKEKKKKEKNTCILFNFARLSPHN